MAAVVVADGRRRGRAWAVARLPVIAVAVGLAAASCSGQPAPAVSAPPGGALAVKACTVNGQAARCGTLIVPEDRLTGTGRMIPVRFVVFPATGPDRAPDPVVYFAGGPGDSAVTEFQIGGVPDLTSLNAHRDLVFIDQRGTGQSNPLNCPAFPGLADKAALRAAVQSCLAHLNGDLRFYTTAMFTDDVSQILTDLHYPAANLIGISYGTAAEQVFLLRHPSQVRTMTLISGSPLSLHIRDREAGNSQLALDHVFALCESQPACHQAFPHLAADWAALWASLGTSPWVLPAAQSPSKTAVRLDQDAFAQLIYQAMFTGDVGFIPVVVHTLGTATNKAAAMISVINAYPGLGQALEGSGGANQMMPYAINCDEAWSSWRPAAMASQRDSFDYQTDLQTAQWYQYVCPLIPKSAAAVGDLQPTVSKVPVLAFNGAYEQVEQPRNWAGAQALFPGSRDIVLPGQGHDTNNWDICAGPLTQTFIQQASLAHLDTGCLIAAGPPPFDLTLP
jgi:pimeloyl-ACP methyl ester carboxylesterase